LNLSLPEVLLDSLEGIKGFDREAFENLHASGNQVTSIRFNPFKLLDKQEDSGFSVQEKIPWSSEGYYLAQRPLFTFDPLFHAGVYYVQEASGTFLEQALKQTLDLTAPLRVLDLCAAPGGKSSLIQSLISKESLLVSNEVIRSRVNILQENMIKWGGANCFVSNNDPHDFARLENYFDAIVVDAPCSGSGLFRKEPEAISEWKPDLVKLCSLRQQRILSDIWTALKEDGILIYSTCSYSREENEDILDWVMETFATESLRLSLEDNWEIIETSSPKYGAWGYRFYPDKIRGEGLFMACLKKKDGGIFSFPKQKKILEKSGKKEEQYLRSYILEADPLTFFRLEEMAFVIPEGLSKDLLYLKGSLYIKKAGVLLGKLAGTALIPDHELALSTILNQKVQRVDVNLEIAIQYLRKEEIRLETSFTGWGLVVYKKKVLGWIKVLPNRINNYYPKEWRILKRNA
jgi:16S rRNA C967 or C1407 C5-methylase (RsmB/RsmF family)/NOL1/NOP2/fmu family ribosome biogenesis protein